MATLMQKLLHNVPGLEARINQMNSRERMLVSVAAVLLVITLIYFIMWKPIADGISERESKIEAQQELLQWVRENTGAYLAQKSAGAKAGNSAQMPGSVTERVTRLAAAAKIELSRMQPQSDGLLVVIDQVPFNTLLQFVENLQNQAGLTITHVDATEGDAAGVVRVRRLQVSE
jgi:general secretion pathway protein M